MKHQYFGDIIDLFKYDLLQTLSQDIGFNQILFIPLLTENDNGNDGNKRNYEKAQAGNKNQKLIDFFKSKHSNHKHERNAKIIEEYFTKEKINFRFEPEEIFRNKNRKEYFLALLSSLSTLNAKNQLLFFDPDNGMQVKHNKDKHIKYQELKNHLDMVCKNSVLSVIQFRHRANWKISQQKRKNDLIIEVSPFVTFIANKTIALYFITKSHKRLNEVKKSLKNYKKSYPDLWVDEDLFKLRDIVEYKESKIKRIALVFSCPGQLEQIYNKLVFGKTGCNLELLLKELKSRNFVKEDFKDRYDFTITNSHNKVHYKSWNNRTEPLLSEVKVPENIERLTTEFKDAEIIICFGKRPKIALEICKDNLKAKVLYSRHLGLQSLNQISEDINGNKLTKGKEGNTDKRIQVVAKELIDQYNQNK